MQDEHALVRVPQHAVALPAGAELRVVALLDGVCLQHVNRDGQMTGSLAVSEPLALARLLRHGGGARHLTYRDQPVPVGLSRDGADGYLLARDLCIELPKAAAVAAADTLDPEPQHLQPEVPGSRDWPPRAYGLHETATIYVADHERWVVSLIVGYGTDADVSSPLQAARAALELTTEVGSDGTHWFVYDRETGRMHLFKQDEFDPALHDVDADGATGADELERGCRRRRPRRHDPGRRRGQRRPVRDNAERAVMGEQDDLCATRRGATVRAAPHPCAECPWRTENHGREERHGFYGPENLRRLWDGLRDGERMTCHPTDPAMAEFAGYESTAHRRRTRECAGALVLIQRELMRLNAAAQDPAVPAGHALARYHEVVGELAMTRNGVASHLFALQAGSTPLSGGVSVRLVDLAEPDVAMPGLPACGECALDATDEPA
jgi:hypothetical protein